MCKGSFFFWLEGLKKIKEHKPDFAIIDLSLPDVGGEVIIKDLYLNHSNTKIIVYSWQSYIQQVTHLMSIGISGYVTKDSSVSDIILALENINLGQKYISPYLNEVLLRICMSKNEHTILASYQKPLTERELEISKLICSGTTPAKISKILSISHSTVRAHIKNLLEKLGLKKISELSMFRKHLLIDR